MRPIAQNLAAVPSIVHDALNRKASLTGVTYLKQGKYKSRYTGGKKFQVDINGNLWESADLKKLISAGNEKSPRRNAGRKRISLYQCTVAKVDKTHAQNTINNENCFSRPPLAYTPPAISFPQPRFYTVKKSLVRQRITNYINTQAGKKQLYFFTVTFPMGTPDNKAYQIFNIWLTRLRKHRMLREYIWVAERQGEKSTIGNTTIHFHMAVPHFMRVQRANSMMAGTLKTFARRGEIPFSVYQCNRYNGVDIAKNKNTKRVVNFAVKKGARALATYLTKYITKNDTKFTHLAWHNSRGFSAVFTGVTFNKGEFANNGFFKLLNWEKPFETEYIIFYPWKTGPPGLLTDHLYNINTFIHSLLNQTNEQQQSTCGIDY